MVAGWLTLAVSRCGEQWFACVAGMPLKVGRETLEYDDADRACQAAEEEARALLDKATLALLT